jgi:hypothetical protein
MPFGQAKTSGFNNPKVTKIVVSGTGAGTGVFVYNGTPGLGNPPITWLTNGSLLDPYGNVLPAVIGVSGTGTFSAGDTLITPNGTFTYSGTPALGNLIYSDSSGGGTDSEGNLYLPGSVGYFQTGGTWYAVQTGTIQGLAFYSAGTAGGPWVEVGSITAGPDIVLTSNRYITTTNPLMLGATPLSPTMANYAAFYGNTNATPTAGTPGGVAGQIPLTQVKTGVSASGNVTAFTLITNQYTLDSTLIANTLYTLRVEFNGTWGAQLMSIGADINGTTTNLTGLAAAFATGAVSGDGINGWIEIGVYIVSSSACRISCKGYVHDLTVAANNSDTSGSGISGTVATGVAIAGSNTLGIAIKFAASVAAQTITPEFETFTRTGS